MRVFLYETVSENFFRVKVTQKLSHACSNFDPYTSSKFESFLNNESVHPEKLSQIDSNSTMTELLSQVDSKKLALFLFTQFTSQFISPSHKTVRLTQIRP